MTPSQLREWSFQNSQPDQWWLSLDAVTEEIPVTVSEIEEHLKSGLYGTIQALHVSQAGMENAPWVELTMPPVMKAPSAMQPLLAVVAPAPLPALPPTATDETQKPQETLGIIILVLPLATSLLIWQWVGGMNLLQNPGSVLTLLSIGTVVATGILAGIEAEKLGVGKGKKLDKNGREKHQTGPIGWAIYVMLAWVFSFPAYMYWRSRYGAKNMLIGGIGVALLFLGITSWMAVMIDNSRSRAVQVAESFQQETAHLEAQFVEPKSTISPEQAMKKRLNEIANDAIEKCQIATDSEHFDDAAIYSGIAAQAFLELGDEDSYRTWKKFSDDWTKIAAKRYSR